MCSSDLTGLDRNLMFNRQYIVPHALGPWSAENNGITDVFDASFVKEWVKHSTVSTSEQQKNIFFAKINEMLWRSSGIPLYETSFFIETAKSLQINFTNLPKNEFARDRSHPGRTIIKSIAKKIFDEVQSNNLI